MQALEDALATIQAQPDFPKGWSRKAAALVGKVLRRESGRERRPFCISTNACTGERAHMHAHTQHARMLTHACALTRSRTHAPRTHLQGDFEGAIKAYTRCLDLDADNTSGLCSRV